MSTSNPVAPRSWTWAAILVSIALMIPGLLVGGIIQWVYLIAAGRYLGDTIFSWVGLEIVDQFFMVLLPAFIQGGAAGALVIWVTSLIFKRADYTAVTYSFMTVVCCLGVLSLVMSYYLQRLASLDTVGIIATTVSTVVGAYFAMVAVKEHQKGEGIAA